MTNVVDVLREVVVTNVVTVTNAVEVRAARAENRPSLTARKTAPYLVQAKAMTPDQLRKLLSGAAARVVTCESGALALVEASDRVIRSVESFADVRPLLSVDKIAAGVGERVRVVPLSSIDTAPIAAAIGTLGGEVVRVDKNGSPAVIAKMSNATIRKLAERGDVRRIEREEEK